MKCLKGTCWATVFYNIVIHYLSEIGSSSIDLLVASRRSVSADSRSKFQIK